MGDKTAPFIVKNMNKPYVISISQANKKYVERENSDLT